MGIDLSAIIGAIIGALLKALSDGLARRRSEASLKDQGRLEQSAAALEEQNKRQRDAIAERDKAQAGGLHAAIDQL